MAEPRAKTLQEKMGFLDEDLKRPDHDTILLAVQEHVDVIVKSYLPPATPEWPSKLLEDLQSAGVRSFPANPRFRIDSIIWEQPVLSGKFIVGFIDMLITWVTYSLDLRSTSSGEPVAVLVEDRTHYLAIEVKTQIRSLGELVRQLRMYEQYRLGSYCVVSPDGRYSKQLRKQGFGFVRYVGGATPLVVD
jgi:hypothetical protein